VATFAQAFEVVATQSKGDCTRFDLGVLRECHSAFKAFELPHRVESFEQAKQIGDWFVAQAGTA
jgi:hypothetical protein